MVESSMKEKENTISCNHVSNSHKETADVEGGHAVSQEGHAGPQLLHGEDKPKRLCCAKNNSERPVDALALIQEKGESLTH